MRKKDYNSKPQSWDQIRNALIVIKKNYYTRNYPGYTNQKKKPENKK